MTAVITPPPTPRRARDQAAPPLGEATKALIDRINTQLSEADEAEVRGRRDTGKLISGLLGRPEEHGLQSLTELEKYLPFKRDTLRPCRDLAEKFSDEQFDELLGLRGPNGFHLGWAHFAVLSRAQGTWTQVRALARRAVQEQLNRNQVWAEVQELAGGKQSPGGRKMAVPKSVAELLTQAKAAVEALTNRINGAWLADEAPDYVAEVQGMTNPERKAVRKEAEAVSDQIETLYTALSTLEGDLGRIRGAAAAPAPDTRARASA